MTHVLGYNLFMAIIGLRPIGELEPAILARLVAPLAVTFGLEVRVGPALSHPYYAYDATRRQYQASLILAQLQAARWPDEQHILGVFDGDLFAPQLNFAFGEASRRERSAVIGLARLRSDDPARFARRILIEAIHELGHSYGLSHCPSPGCVMHFSNRLEDTDYKQPALCPRCRLKVM